jgi:copper chaperone
VKVSLSVPDISCGHCVMRVKKALGESGIEAQVELESKEVIVDSGKEEAAREILARIDYPALKKEG